MILSVVFSTAYAREIPERVFPAAATAEQDPYGRGITGVFLDLQKNAAVGTNSHRMHVLQLPMMGVEVEKEWKDVPRGVQVPLEVYQYLAAVEDREYTGFRLGHDKIMVGHNDFGLITEPQNLNFPNWDGAMPEWPGRWTADRETFLAAVKEASLILGDEPVPYIDFAFDLNAKNVTVVSTGSSGDRFERTVEARPSGKLMSFVTIRLNAVYTLDAIDACRGSSIRIGLGREMDQITFRGDDDYFTGIVMPRKRDE